MGQPIKLYVDLSDHVGQLFQRFLSVFFPAEPDDGPEKFGDAVKAYCLLSHAAFEEFAEELSVLVMNRAIENWTARGIMETPLLTLVGFYGAKLSIEENEAKEQNQIKDVIRDAVQHARRMHYKAISDNHGFSLKYLRKALTPVGIDIITEEKLLNSLRTLANARGSYAHTVARHGYYKENRSRATRSISPEQARDLIHDCLEICLNLSEVSRSYLIANPEQV